MSRVESAVILCITVMLIAMPTWADEEASVVVNTPPATEDRLELDITSIRGNQELPRVMYIVPWKDPAMGNLVGKPVNSLVDEVLTPVDRDVFRRQTMYFEQLYGESEPGAAE
jgi:hypothetical protein